VPGVATSSEIELAMSLGVSTLKFFPAETMGGVATLKALAGPYPDVRFIPTGGITPELLPTYLKLPNVVACGGSIACLIEQASKMLAPPPEVAT
jgi:2-dehydro-3-deoxyphosphogluconate aldolase/(4S)-4-hydroxy-2-oxoglutarate aldolase